MKEIKELKLLYAGIILLGIVVFLLVIILFAPPFSKIRKKVVAPPEGIFDADQVQQMLGAPGASTPPEIPQDALESLEGTGNTEVQAQEVYDMLSAPPQQ